MEDKNASNNCTLDSYKDVYDILVDVRATVSAVSAVCILLVIATIFLFQKYHFLTQRLILYLAFASLCFSIEGCINVVSTEVYEEPQFGPYCAFVGLVNLITTWWVVMATFCIMLDVFIKVATFKRTERLEICYVLATFVLPVVLICWIPFIGNRYGPAGPICWIQTLKNCEKDYVGVAFQLALYYLPVFLLMIIVMMLLVVSVILLRKRAKEWEGKYDPHTTRVKRKMQAEVHPLFVYPIVLIFANILTFVNRLYGAVNAVNTTPVPLLFFSFIMYKLQGAFVTMAFALDKETRKKLTGREIVAAIRRLTPRYNKINEFSIVQEPEESVDQQVHAVEPDLMTGYRTIDD